MGEIAIAQNWRESFKTRDRRPIYEWAKDNVRLSPPLTITDWFDVSLSRHFIAPFDALQNDRVREVNIMAPVRDGKSLIVEVWLPWLIVNNPGSFRWVFQDDQAAVDQERQRSIKTLQSVAAILPFVPLGTIELNNVMGMVVRIDGPSTKKLQSRGYQNMAIDEPWQYKPGAIEEARGRQGDYVKLQNNKFLCISQGGETGSDWDSQFKSGMIHEWNVPCQGCGGWIEPHWSGFREDGSKCGMVWDEFRDDRGFWNTTRAAATARYICPHCGFSHVDTPRLKSLWNAGGKYTAEKADKSEKKVSFHWSSVITYPWEDMVDLYLSAINKFKTGSPVALIQFFQKRMAEHSSEQTVHEANRSFARQKYQPDSTWELEEGRLLTIDKQQEGVYWWMVCLWTSRNGGMCRRVGFGKAQGEAELLEIQKRYGVPSNWVLIDAGYHAKGAGGVYSMCIRNSWLATKGIGSVNDGRSRIEGFWHTEDIGAGKTIRVQRTYAELDYGDPETGSGERANLIKFSADHIADRLDGLITSGQWIEPEGEEDLEYKRQMSSEFKKLKENPFSKRQEYIRVCPSKNNHAYDCAKIQNLGAVLMEWLTDPLDNRTQSEKVAA
jgi:hypothetical protein